MSEAGGDVRSGRERRPGRSWLYRYLSAHPDCHLPGLKELHYFDARAFGRQAAERKRIRELRRRLMATLRGARPERALRLAERDRRTAMTGLA